MDAAILVNKNGKPFQFSCLNSTLTQGMGVSRQGDAKQGVLIDVRAVCSIQPVGTDTVINNIPGTQLTSWNVSTTARALGAQFEPIC